MRDLSRLPRLLLRAYPREFRDAVGDAFVDASVDRMRDRRRRGWPMAAIWIVALADTLRHAPAERARAWLDARHARSRHHALTAGERTMMDTLLQDVRYALRLWRKRPAFACIAILTLALGVGANTAMFSIVNAVLLRSLPYANAERLVSVWSRTAQFPRGLLSYQEYEELQKQSGSLEALALYLAQSVNLTGVAEPQRLVGIFVTGSFFDVLGLKAERGRLFTEDESAPGGVKPVVVITRQFWQQRFGGAPDIVGRSIALNGIPLTIVGVMAPPFDATTVPGAGYFIDGDVFLPAAQYPTPRGLRSAGAQMLAVGRLKPGVAIRTAGADIDVIARRLTAADPDAQAGRTIEVGSAQENIVGSSRTALFLLFASVGVVLLIACVNVSHLLLARAMDRQKEMALRAALGASRAAVTRQLAVEAAMVAAAAAVAGFLLGRWALAGLAWLRPPSVPIPAHVPLDRTVLLFTGGIAIGVAMLCGLAPALKSSRTDISRVLQAGARRASAAGRRTRDVLVVAEMAMSVALVAVSALLIQSLLAAQNAPLGFDASNVFTLQFRLPQTKYTKPEDIARFFKSAIENVRAVPGVQSAALVRAVPFSGNGGTTGYAVEGTPADPASLPQARLHFVTPDYFKTLRIPLLKGRDFTDRDDLTTPLVAVINETFARRNWPDGDAIGKRFTTPDTPTPVTVVGVVGDTKHYTATEPAVPQLYVAHYQVPLIFCSLVARTSVPPMTITNEVRRAIWAVDKDQPVWSIYSLETAVARTQGQSRFLALLLGIFAGVALLLAGVGIYGMTSYGVAQRTHEIGIRLALGASSERVLGEVVGHGVRLTLVAVAVGLAAAVAMGRLAGAVLFQVAPGDPQSLAAAAVILSAVSLIACYLPARRAARIDPVVALNEE
ncbi:MAG: ABC transporter permease [Acidobacteriia bacterium]|nr:ABC transporter permease [Terriglobia bacterium]